MGRRQALDIPGIGHGAPIPMGCRVGNVLYSSAVMGADPATGEVPEDGAEQVRLVFENIRTLVGLGGGSTDDIVFMSVLLGDNSLRKDINQHWLEMFPNPEDRPARHISKVEPSRRNSVQVEFVAVLGD
jgi:2-iminobutanoate/2-iminopropanoate deaminase